MKNFLLLLLILPITIFGNPIQDNFTANTHFSVCFTPHNDCTGMIVDAIDHAKHVIDIQAYSFTSSPIIHSLIMAKQRGVVIQALLDKSNLRSRYSVVNVLAENGITFLIDYLPAIAHNKVMVIDNSKVVTGSFNFTKNAQVRNAENVIMIDSPKLANDYLVNFNERKKVSITLAQYHQHQTNHAYSHRHRGYRNKYYG